MWFVCGDPQDNGKIAATYKTTKYSLSVYLKSLLSTSVCMAVTKLRVTTNMVCGDPQHDG